MRYKGRYCRRLYRVRVYTDEARTQTTEETVIAWNPVDANRRAQAEISEEPEALHFVTWDEPPRRIDTPQEGPLEVIEPTIATPTGDAW